MHTDKNKLLAHITATVNGTSISEPKAASGNSDSTGLESHSLKLNSRLQPVHAALNDAWKARTPPFDKDLVSLADIRGRLAHLIPRLAATTDRRLATYLRQPPISAKPIRHQRTIRTPICAGRVRLWIIHNVDLWIHASDREISRHLERTHPTTVAWQMGVDSERA
jgi:hypothetical protein